MNKAELINAAAEKAGLSKKDTETAINAAIEVISDCLAEGDKVQLVGFGAFEVKSRAERIGRNPKTKESIKIPASKVPVFKPGHAPNPQRDRKRGGARSSRTASPADEKAVAPQAQGVFHGGVSSVASRSRRSVTASAQALDHSLPGEPERSFPPLGLLFPTRTASLGSRGGHEGGERPAP